MKLKQSKETVSTLLLLKHWRWTRSGQLGFLGSAGNPEMGAGKYWSLWWRSTDGHSGWRICWRNQCIHTGKHSFKLKYEHSLSISWVYILHEYCLSLFKQTLSPQAKGLFQRAIFQSGVATLGTYTTNHPLSQAQVLKFEMWRIWSSSQWLYFISRSAYLLCSSFEVASKSESTGQEWTVNTSLLIKSSSPSKQTCIDTLSMLNK